VVKALSHMRTLKAKFVNIPTTICREYSRAWEERLGAEGKPWTWDGDVLRAINFGKYRSMLRVFAMFGAVKALQEKKQYARAEAQVVQCLKSIHQFALDGSWKVAWPLTFLVDPVEKAKTGATEPELEAVLAYLRVHEDIRRKTKATGSVADAVSSGSDDDPGEGGGAAAAAKKKKGKKGGAGGGGSAAAWV